MASQGDHVDCARLLLYHKAQIDDVTVVSATPVLLPDRWRHCGKCHISTTPCPCRQGRTWVSCPCRYLVMLVVGSINWVCRSRLSPWQQCKCPFPILKGSRKSQLASDHSHDLMSVGYRGWSIQFLVIPLPELDITSITFGANSNCLTMNGNKMVGW